MARKNGFMATSLLYSFLILFIALMLGIIANYVHNRILLRTLNNDVKDNLGKDFVMKYQLQNQFVNSDFMSTTDWRTNGNVTVDQSYGYRSPSSIKLAPGASIKKIIHMTLNHIYYFRVKVSTQNAGNSTGRIEITELASAGSMHYLAIPNKWTAKNFSNWTTMSYLGSSNIDFGSYYYSIYNNYGSVPLWVDQILMVDLTETFGAGKEPAKEWCDRNIPYFEGTVSTDFS